MKPHTECALCSHPNNWVVSPSTLQMLQLVVALILLGIYLSNIQLVKDSSPQLCNSPFPCVLAKLVLIFPGNFPKIITETSKLP